MPPTAARLLTLLTDYGSGGPFVGALHAVAALLAPDVRVIDLDHSVPPHDVRVGALRLESFVADLPVGVHVAVVDPGVGTSRRPIAARCGPQIFVGPDNGLLAWALEAAGGVDAVVEITAAHVRRRPGARTFDGRDLFVPTGVQLAEGHSLESFGAFVDPRSLVVLARAEPQELAGGGLALEVAQLDRFGNVQFFADARAVAHLCLEQGASVVVETPDGRRQTARYGSAFSDVPVGDLVLLLDSDGRLALARNQGRAQAALGVDPGAPVLLRVVSTTERAEKDPLRGGSDEGP